MLQELLRQYVQCNELQKVQNEHFMEGGSLQVERGTLLLNYVFCFQFD